jgi:hypothetical protein
MAKRLSRSALLLVLAALWPTDAVAQEPTPAGYWEGSIDIRGNALDIAVELKTDAEGTWSGVIDIPAQDTRGMNLANVMVEGRDVAFAMSGVPGNPAFSGTLSDDGKAITGDYTQGITELTFRLRRSVRRQADGATPTTFTQPGVPGEDLAGIWVGVLDPGAVELRLIARIAKDGEGAYRGTVDCVDQGARGL